jgi:hypothetical protein
MGMRGVRFVPHKFQWNPARIVDKAFLNQDSQGPGGQVVDRPLRGAESRGPLSREAPDLYHTASQDPPEFFWLQAVNQFMVPTMKGDLVSHCLNELDQLRMFFDHIAQYKESGERASSLQQRQQLLSIRDDRGRQIIPASSWEQTFHFADVIPIFQVYRKDVYTVFIVHGWLLCDLAR